MPVRSRRSLSLGVVVLALLAGLLATAPMSASAPVNTLVGVTCAVSGPLVETGSPLISAPMATQITGAPLAMSIPIDASVTTEINPGGTVAVSAVAHVDLTAIAADILENRVKPGIVAAGFPQLAPSSWVVLDLTDASLTYPLDPATSADVGVAPAAASSVGTAAGSWTPGGPRVSVDRLLADSRVPGPSPQVSLSWRVVDGGGAPPRALTLGPPALTFTAEVTVGLLFFGSPITGGVRAPWGCTPDAPTTVLGTTAVVGTPVTSDPALSSTTTMVSGSTLPPPATSTSVSWPTSTTTPAGSCAISGFDRYGGYTGIQLGATGFFRTAQIDGRWWLVDPDGHPFFSTGINHVTFTGTVDRHGATPYRDAVQAKYGTPEAWAAAQKQRMDAWGYNTVGAWSDLDQLAPMGPYALLVNVTGQNFATGEMEDIFAPGWEAGVHATMASVAAARGSDPNLVGYWLDNELHFGPDWRELHQFDAYLAWPASSPGKQALVSWLQARYPSFAAFAADFSTSATDWASLLGPTTVASFTPTAGQATRTGWVGVLAERYFSVTAAAVHGADPNHLFLGPRLIAHTAGRPLLEAAARHVDVVSMNLYPILPELVGPLLNADPTYLPVDGPLAAQAAILQKPVLISEWSYRAADSGLPNTWPPLFPTLETQAQRAAAYEQYVQGLLGTSFVVGHHFFEHSDEPPAGRSDGEDSNFGLVNLQDEPYALVTAISRTMHDCAYARLLAPAAITPTTTAVAPTTSVRAAVPVTATPAFTG